VSSLFSRELAPRGRRKTFGRLAGFASLFFLLSIDPIFTDFFTKSDLLLSILVFRSAVMVRFHLERNSF
jgi:hypothetical protein